ncbi:MAG: chemotaxis protein [Planctomycetota bacterium]|nr:MAG: chemotaxis protein [Planctomycetota bacterium]
MRHSTASLTGVERTFDKDEIIVSKTDLKGRITYANRTFLKVSGYSEAELLGQPHNIIRHPDMPRCVFQLLWETIQSGREIFAYVVNRAKNGDHYWVFANITPTFDGAGHIIGYHSNRRVADRNAVRRIRDLYRQLSAAEAPYANPNQACSASRKVLDGALAQLGQTYEEFVFTLARRADPATASC